VKVCASVDLDNYREYRRLVDPDGALPDVSFYDAALPRFLDAFDRHGMRATFFVVGKDLEVGAHRRAIREVAERGHEVGNHSWSHPYNLRSLPRREKEQEIARAEQALADAVGERPLGFRCPSGELDRDILQILDERGYLYDSTVFPSPFMWLFMLYGRLFVRHAHYQLGEVTAVLAPRGPYLPTAERIHRPQRSVAGSRDAESRGPSASAPRVVEIPISAVPVLGLPFYGTLFRMLRPGVFDASLRLHARARRPVLTMIYHLLDLVDYRGSPLEEALRRTPGVGIPFERRERFMERSLASLARAGACVPLREAARDHLAARGVERPDAEALAG
jgi:hypothetical protein